MLKTLRGLAAWSLIAAPFWVLAYDLSKLSNIFQLTHLHIMFIATLVWIPSCWHMSSPPSQCCRESKENNARASTGNFNTCNLVQTVYPLNSEIPHVYNYSSTTKINMFEHLFFQNKLAQLWWNHCKTMFNSFIQINFWGTSNLWPIAIELWDHPWLTGLKGEANIYIYIYTYIYIYPHSLMGERRFTSSLELSLVGMGQYS